MSEKMLAGLDSRTIPAGNALALPAMMCASAAIMILLFWHFPLTTTVIALSALVMLGVSAHSARVSARLE